MFLKLTKRAVNPMLVVFIVLVCFFTVRMLSDGPVVIPSDCQDDPWFDPID